MGVVRVVADLGGEVEGDRQSGLALVDQVAVAAVGFLGGGVASVLPHSPQPSPIHGGLDAARIRILAGKTELIEIGVVFRWKIQPLDRNGGRGLKPALSFRETI